MRNPNPLFRNCSDKFFVFRNGKTCPVAHLTLDTGELKTTEGKAEVPSLDKEGWLRPLRKCREASLAGADGVVGSSHRLSEVERTTPAAPPKERDHLLDGAATPPVPGVPGGDHVFRAVFGLTWSQS